MVPPGAMCCLCQHAELCSSWQVGCAYLVGSVDGGEGVLEAHYLPSIHVCLERAASAQQIIVTVLNSGQSVIGRRKVGRVGAEESFFTFEEGVVGVVASEVYVVTIAARLGLACRGLASYRYIRV
jgi:hypothetical protein